MEGPNKKVCLNCGGNWEECHGYECLCVEGICCDNKEDRLSNMKNMAFGYKEIKK